MLLKTAICFIEIYRAIFSPLLPPSCLYEQSCSRFALVSLKKYGLVLGLFLAVKRVLSCNLFFHHRYKEVL